MNPRKVNKNENITVKTETSIAQKKEPSDLFFCFLKTKLLKLPWPYI